MRRYLWGFTADETPPELEGRSCEHVEDVKDGGGVIVECGWEGCHKHFNEKDLELCPHCGNDIIFPRAEW